ncbi:MAG: sigma factor, partial [Cyanobacteria bacterium J06649_11]
MSQHQHTELKEILRGCSKERRSSQHALYRLFYAYGMSICIRYVENENEAISILNDAFLKVFRNINRFDFEQPFKPWFRKILVNTAINNIKKKHKYRAEVPMENAKEIA